MALFGTPFLNFISIHQNSYRQLISDGMTYSSSNHYMLVAVHHDTLQGAAMFANHEIVEYCEQLLAVVAFL